MQGSQYQLGDFQLRVGKVVPTHSESLRGIVMEVIGSLIEPFWLTFYFILYAYRTYNSFRSYYCRPLGFEILNFVFQMELLVP